ncbi:MAG: FAD binding domain-containing protein [Chloroflexi bacterium]|nr:FAD binding domain-containing protein [Chloroflexota bacterium]
MTLWEHYHLPRSVDEALSSLAAYDGRACVVAGGTDLLLELQQGRKPPVAALVDVTRVSEMTQIAETDGTIYVGAAVTHTHIVASPLLAARATCLVESCGVVGGPQVRNVGTLGGNVAHALPAGDGTISLVALEAEAEIAVSGRRSAVSREWRPVLSLFKGPGKSALDRSRELIVRFRFKGAGSGEGSAFKRMMRPQGVALPIMGMAVRLKVSGGVVDEARIALGPAGPTPMRATKAETYLSDIPLVDDVLPQLADLVLQDAQLRTSPHRATADYRAELIPVLLERALKLAHRRAATGEAVPEGLGM